MISSLVMRFLHIENGGGVIWLQNYAIDWNGAS